MDCALTAAKKLLGGNRLAYALARSPCHHADPSTFGGFCYFNSAAVVAEYLSTYGKIGLLDVDYHPGNGQQEIFYALSGFLLGDFCSDIPVTRRWARPELRLVLDDMRSTGAFLSASMK